MGIVAEFARYKATLVNHFWAVSALTDTELVASLWEHRIKVVDGQWVYQDHLSRWRGNGSKLMGEHLAQAVAEGRPVRIVKATTDNVPLIEGGGDGSKARNTLGTGPNDPPPMKMQVCAQRRIEFVDAPLGDGPEGDRLMDAARRVRNNLVHGGKEHARQQRYPSHDDKLARAAIDVMFLAMASHPEVSQLAFYD